MDDETLLAELDVVGHEQDAVADDVLRVGKWPFRKRKVVHYLPRPAMRLAYDVAVKKFLPKLIENSIVP